MTETLTHSGLGIDDLDALYPAGEPLPESGPHHRVRTRAFTVLEQRFSTRGDVYVAGNLNLYYAEGVRAAVVEPDVMVIAGVDKAQLAAGKSYRTFQHGGSLLFVLEVASEETVDADGDHKRTLYADIGAAEYWRVDPTGGEIQSEILQAERLHDGRWAPIPVTVDGTGTWRSHSKSLGLDIAWRPRELLFYLPGSDQPLNDLPRAETALSAAETALRASEAAHRDERQARRAAERKAAAADAENARLRELLRREGSPEAGPPPDPPG